MKIFGVRNDEVRKKVMMYTALSVVHQQTFVSASLTWKVSQTFIFTMPISVTQ